MTGNINLLPKSDGAVAGDASQRCQQVEAAAYAADRRGRGLNASGWGLVTGGIATLETWRRVWVASGEGCAVKWVLLYRGCPDGWC